MPKQGNPPAPSPASTQRAEGFTLVEILVVMVIIGILAAVTALSLGSTGSRQLAGQATELRIHFNHLVDQALVQGQELQWRYWPESGRCQTYQFDDTGTWQPLPARDAQDCPLDAIETLTLTYPGLPPETDVLAEYATHASHDDNRSESKGRAEGRQEDNHYQSLYFFSSGEYTAFDLTLEHAGQRVMLTGDGFNDIQLVAGP